jgi:uncharacterized protein (DUF1697 family)
LKVLYEELTFENVRTYIQSGNVIFTSEDSSPADLSGRIEQKLLEKYAFEVPVIIRTVKEIKDLLASNVFLEREGIAADKLYVTFLAQPPTQEHIAKVEQLGFEPDEFRVQGKEVYVFCPNGYGRTKITNTFFENKLKVKATTRNWKTVNELLKIADENLSR